MLTMNALAEAQTEQAAPDFTLRGNKGTYIGLSDYRGKKRVVLFFVRTYTCHTCREHVKMLGRMYPQFQALDTEILIILNADINSAVGYADVTGVPFPVLADPDHSIYENYGLNKIFILSTRMGSVAIKKDGTISYMKSSYNPWGWGQESNILLEHLRA